ncbi:MAG: GNAT family N-acetyltransferase [Amoebophilaceae bacterium]|nr:GNAT family N-acetyltransferase [Amoebophilaceae bacterium]
MLGNQWDPTTSIQEVTAWCHSWLNEEIPLAYIALDNGLPIGMCSLEDNDGIRTDLTPWLCDLCVVKSYQNKGGGKLLITAVKAKAKALGFHQLYLFVLDVAVMGYYHALGWDNIGEDLYKGHKVNIMQIDL